MHLQAYLLFAASLASALPYRLSLPEIAIQIFSDHKSPKSQFEQLGEPCKTVGQYSLPEQFTLEVASGGPKGAPFGFVNVNVFATATIGQQTKFILRDGRLLALGGDEATLAVGKSPVRVYPPWVALVPPGSEGSDEFEVQAVEKEDGTYIELRVSASLVLRPEILSALLS